MARPSLLLVDDDKNTLDGLIRILRLEGYPVSGVLSGSDALRLLSEKNFDVMITDMNMPGMDGLTLIHEVRKTRGDVAIVIVTADSSAKMALHAGENPGYDHYLTKPVNIEELKTVLEKLWKKQGLIARNRTVIGKPVT